MPPMPFATVVKVPNNVQSITLPDGAHIPDANFNVTDASDADATILIDSFNKPHIITSQPNGQTTISMPANVSSITINSVVYTPDGSQYNTVTGPDADMTLFIEQGFVLVDVGP